MSHIIGARGAMKLHHLHRITEMEDCAPEGGQVCCNGECNQGRTCPVRIAQAQKVKSVEEEFPWMWAVYGVTILLTILASSVIAS